MTITYGYRRIGLVQIHGIRTVRTARNTQSLRYSGAFFLGALDWCAQKRICPVAGGGAGRVFLPCGLTVNLREVGFG